MGEEGFLYIALGGAVIWLLVGIFKVGIASKDYHPTAVDLIIPAVIAGVIVSNSIDTKGKND